jgi:hypothetical protein
LDICNLKRFSPSDADETEMKTVLKRTENIMSRLAKELGK